MPWKKKHPIIAKWFLRIAEPRGIRLMQFGVYTFIFVAGLGVLLDPPDNFRSSIGLALVYLLASFITIGPLFGMIAVLPGIWWLERVGLIAMGTGVSMYIALIVSMNASLVNIGISSAFLLTFIQRWTEIKGAQLAPKEV